MTTTTADSANARDEKQHFAPGPILTEAVREPADSAGLFTALLDRFAVLGGIDLELPARAEPARAADFTA